MPENISVIKLAFLEQELEETKSQMHSTRSECLNHMLNVKVMLEEGSYDEALEYLVELTE